MTPTEYILNKLSVERTAYDIAIRSGDLEKQQRSFTRIKLLEELSEGIYKLEN